MAAICAVGLAFTGPQPLSLKELLLPSACGAHSTVRWRSLHPVTGVWLSVAKLGLAKETGRTIVAEPEVTAD